MMEITKKKYNALMKYAISHLRWLMIDISEGHYCAGWMQDNEYILWLAVQEGPIDYGMKKISEYDIRAMKELSELTGGWVVWRDGDGATFIPIDEWIEIYEEYAAAQGKLKEQ